MLKKYSDFINESIELILESDVVYSSKFRTTLSKIDNPISDKLLSIENKDLPTQSNYFDIVIDKNDTLSFIPDRRAQTILGDSKEIVTFIGGDGGWLKHSESNNTIFGLLGYTPEGDVYKPNSTEVGEVIKKVVSPESSKTYVWVKFPNGQGVFNEQKLRPSDKSNEVWSTNRQNLKVGRAVRALLKASGEEVLDKDIELFVNLYKSSIDKLNDKFSNFDVVTGDNIAHWYNYQNYYSQTGGTLGGSCMKAARSSWLEIYTSNPNQVALVIFRSPDDSERIIGRSLLWTLKDGTKFMDRIYTTSDSDILLFKEYAKENGWYVKANNNSSSNSESYGPDGKIKKLDLTIKLDNSDYENYPYLDTLKYYKNGVISSEHMDGSYTLEDTGGHYVSCEICDGSGEVECPDCYGSTTMDCNDCNGKGTVLDDDGKSVDCDMCHGGSVDCETCCGNGTVSCYECS